MKGRMAKGGRHLYRFSLAMALTLIGSANAFAQDAKSSTPTNPAPTKSPIDGDGWHFMVAPYAWALGVNGTIGVGKRKADVDASFLDILRASNSLIGVEGHAEAQRQRFGFFLDGIYADIGASAHESSGDGFTPADLNVNADFQLSLLEAGAFYRVIDQYQLWSPYGNLGGGRFSFDALAGARYTNLDVGLNGKLSASGTSLKRAIDGRYQWVDPFIGGRMMIQLADSIDFQLRGDIGGFGAGSDFSWNTQALLGYRFTLLGAKAEAYAGYRALAQDYTDGSGHNAFKWNIILHGPAIGMSITW